MTRARAPQLATQRGGLPIPIARTCSPARRRTNRRRWQGRGILARIARAGRCLHAYQRTCPDLPGRLETSRPRLPRGYHSSISISCGSCSGRRSAQRQANLSRPFHCRRTSPPYGGQLSRNRAHAGSAFSTRLAAVTFIGHNHDDSTSESERCSVGPCVGPANNFCNRPLQGTIQMSD